MIFECSFYNCELFINFFEQFLPRKNPKYCSLLVFRTEGCSRFVLLSNVNEYIRQENFIVDILNKIVFFVMFSSYILK